MDETTLTADQAARLRHLARQQARRQRAITLCFAALGSGHATGLLRALSRGEMGDVGSFALLRLASSVLAWVGWRAFARDDADRRAWLLATCRWEAESRAWQEARSRRRGHHPQMGRVRGGRP